MPQPKRNVQIVNSLKKTKKKVIDLKFQMHLMSYITYDFITQRQTINKE